MTGYRTRWACPPEQPEGSGADRHPRGACLGQGRLRPGLARRPSTPPAWPGADTTTGEIGCTEDGGTEPAIALLRRLATALDAAARLSAGHDLGPARFEPHAA